MILGQVIRPGDEIKQEFPCVKRWQSYNTYALVSSETQAVIISADTAHDNDFVGKQVEDCNDVNWVLVDNFEIVISSN